jgi:hypothetical protein
MLSRRSILGFIIIVTVTVFPALGQQVPAVPQNFTASQGTFTDKVLLSWSSAPFATSYEIWRNVSDDRSSAVLIASNITGTTQFTDSAWPPEQRYYYWIRAKNLSGLSETAAVQGFRKIVPVGEILWSYDFKQFVSPLFTSDGGVFTTLLFTNTTTNLVRFLWDYAGTNLFALGISDDEAQLYAASVTLGKILALSRKGDVLWERHFPDRRVYGATGGVFGRQHWVVMNPTNYHSRLVVMARSGEILAGVDFLGTTGWIDLLATDGEITYVRAEDGVYTVSDQGEKKLLFQLLYEDPDALPRRARNLQNLLCKTAEGLTLWHSGGENLLTLIGPNGEMIWRVPMEPVGSAYLLKTGYFAVFTGNRILSVGLDGVVQESLFTYDSGSALPFADGSFVLSYYKDQPGSLLANAIVYLTENIVRHEKLFEPLLSNLRVGMNGTIFGFLRGTYTLVTVRGDQLPIPSGDLIFSQRRGMREIHRPFNLGISRNPIGELSLTGEVGRTYILQESESLSGWKENRRLMLNSETERIAIPFSAAMRYFRVDIP